MADDLARLEAPEEIRERWTSRPDTLEILPEAADTLRLFVALGTQWRLSGMEGQPTGLDYAAIEPTARAIGVELAAERFADLRSMEAAAMAEWHERRRGRT